MQPSSPESNSPRRCIDRSARVIAADASARSGWLQCAAEVRQGECRHLTFEPKLHGRVVESLDRLTDLREQVGLGRHLILMGIEPAELTEKDLAIQPQLRRRHVEPDHLGHLQKLIAQRRVREYRAKGDVAAQDLANVQRLLRRPAGAPD